MANENTSGSQKQEPNTAKTADTKKPPTGQTAKPLTPPAPSPKRTGTGGKGGRSRIGGSAVAGAKSTLPKPPPTSNDPNQQQIESYNRTMRRRMQQLKTGPYAEQERVQTLRERRQKRIDRRKERLEERREDLKKSLPGGKITLGRRNTYFLIATIALIVLLIVLFVVLRQMHLLG
jgi:hypothetical protein